MKLISDIGGTYIRIAQVKDGAPGHIKKYKANDFPALTAAIAKYCEDHEIKNSGEIAIAAAGYEENGFWKITNNPDWVINPTNLAMAGWQIPIIINDFEAATYSLPLLQSESKVTLKTGVEKSFSKCILGAGTGLGLGYYHLPDTFQKTHGGHIPIASLNDEHGKTIKEIRATLDRDVVFEDIVSGPALQRLQSLYDKEKASNIFHEFLGIFSATVLVTGHAYGGLYLTGGVITSLYENNEFDFDRFNKSLCFNAVDCVKQDIADTPIHLITDPYPALRGLIHAQSLSDY